MQGMVSCASLFCAVLLCNTGLPCSALLFCIALLGVIPSVLSLLYCCDAPSQGLNSRGLFALLPAPLFMVDSAETLHVLEVLQF